MFDNSHTLSHSAKIRQENEKNNTIKKLYVKKFGISSAYSLIYTRVRGLCVVDRNAEQAARYQDYLCKYKNYFSLIYIGKKRKKCKKSAKSEKNLKKSVKKFAGYKKPLYLCTRKQTTNFFINFQKLSKL